MNHGGVHRLEAAVGEFVRYAEEFGRNTCWCFFLAYAAVDSKLKASTGSVLSRRRRSHRRAAADHDLEILVL